MARITKCRRLGFILYATLLSAITAAAQPPTTKSPTTKSSSKPAATQSAEMSNADVIKMVKAGLSDAVIELSIRRANKHSFNLSPDGLLELKASHVSDAVIGVMFDPASTDPSGERNVGNSSSPSAMSVRSRARPVEAQLRDAMEIKVRVKGSLSSKENKPGDVVQFAAADDVVVNGDIVIAKGAAGWGKVTSAIAQRLRRPGTLAFSVNTVKAIDGQDVKVAGSHTVEGARGVMTSDEAMVESGLLITVKVDGEQKISITAPAEPSITATPTAATFSPTSAANSSIVPEIGVYYKDGNRWVDLPPEVVNWRTGGALKHAVSLKIIKGDVNGSVHNPKSRSVVSQPLEILIYTADGTAATEYQLLRLHPNSKSREFRTVTGGVMHQSGGAVRDLIAVEFNKIAARTYTVSLQDLPRGEYGILAPAAAGANNAAAQIGKIFSFRIE